MFKEVIKGVARNTSVMFLQQLFTWSSTFVLLLFLPRYLGPIEYGRLFLVSSISGIFLIFVNYGGNLVLPKKVSRSKERTGQILVDALGLRLFLWVVSLIGIFVFSQLVGYTSEVTLMLLIAGVGLLWDGATTCLYACYQGNEQMQYTSGGVIAKRVFNSLVGVSILMLGAGATGIVIVFVLGSLLNCMVLIGYAKKIIPRLPKIRWEEMLPQLKEGVPYFLLLAFSTIYYRIDSIMLSLLTPEAIVGCYGAAYRLFDSLNFFPHLVTIALYPVLARLWKGEEQMHKRLVGKGLEFVVLTGVPMTVGVLAFSPDIIRLFYGLPGYQDSIFVLRVLGVGLLLLYVDMLLGTTLLSADKQRQQSLVALSAIPVNIGLNFLLIPFYQTRMGNGGIGAAIATAITELYIMIALIYLIPKEYLHGFRLSVVVKSAMAGVAMALTAWLLSSMVPWPVLAIISVIVFVALIFLLKTFEVKEREFLRSVLTTYSIKDMKNFVTDDRSLLE